MTIEEYIHKELGRCFIVRPFTR